MIRKITAGIILVIVIAGGAWYFTHTRHTSIKEILGNPAAYRGKEVTIEGEVTDRTGFFVVVNFFKVRDKTGEIAVVTRKSLPDLKSTVQVKGTLNDTFPVGDQKFLVLVEKSLEDKGKNK